MPREIPPPQLVVFGAGGHAKVVADIAHLTGTRVVAFVDLVDPDRRGEIFMGAPIATDWESAIARLDSRTRPVLAIGSNAAREDLQRRLVLAGHPPVGLTHPSALVSSHAVVETGAVIGPRAVVNAAARIGAGAIVNSMSLVEHDCVVGPCAHIAPTASLAGAVTVGARTFIGLGARVRDRCRIGDDAVVGAGSVVVADVAAGLTVCGVPARPLVRARAA
jgi:sugar O-acyltransferase (sialic acid O-acetyltransferase NeuD family)